MEKLTITGASDDLIEIDGAIREEFNVYPEDDEDLFVAVSDGTLLSVDYDKDGIWRFNAVKLGSATLNKTEGVTADDTFDVVELTGERFDWVVCGKHTAKR
jgi:hypothetical protein